MKRYTLIHRHDKNNVGDLASNPLQYFLRDDNYTIYDIANLKQSSYDDNRPVIIGGGGLIGNLNFTNTLVSLIGSADKNALKNTFESKWLAVDPANRDLSNRFNADFHQLIKTYLKQLSEPKTPRIIWGAGHNTDIPKKSSSLIIPDYLLEFDMVGIRDNVNDFKWVPCASCMHPALRKTYTVKNEVIWFEHKKQLIKDFGSEPIPRFANSGNNVEQTIELLGSANVILTNSYHGAYWGTLLKKKVIVVEPWSTKFLNFRHQPALMSSTENWRDIIDDVPVFQNALEECMSTTEEWWTEVKGAT